jgi:hypothetical protein
MKYKSGYRYVLYEAETVELPFDLPNEFTLDGLLARALKTGDGKWHLVIGAGYPWDGASFFLFLLFGTPDAWKFASLVHDVLCQAARESKVPIAYRVHFDAFFYQLLRRRGVSWIVAQAAWLAVKIGSNYFIRHGAKVREAI